MKAPPPAPALPSALMDFVLGQAQIHTNVCSRQRPAGLYRLDPRTVPDYNLLYITRGRVVWVINHQPWELGPRDLILVRPGEPHHAYALNPGIDLTSIHVEVRLPGGRDVFDLLTWPRVVHVPAHGRLAGYWRSATREFDRPTHPAVQRMMPAWARLVVLELLAWAAESGILACQAMDPLVAHLLQELARRRGTGVHQKDLVRWSGYSGPYLNRLFRRAIGATPLQYHMRMRLEHAAELLAQDQLSVAGVGRAVGFKDPYYFSRAFRQHFHQSPSEYRRSLGAISPSSSSAPPFPEAATRS